jgi:predicted Zn-ribbon and HTH transcriptional regulator
MMMGDSMGKTDHIGRAIWPQSLNRVLGIRFFSKTQMADASGLDLEVAERLIQTLLEMGVAQPWLAPKCPKCGYVWAEYLGEDDLHPTTKCPLCNHEEETETMQFFHVYEMIGTPDDNE